MPPSVTPPHPHSLSHASLASSPSLWIEKETPSSPPPLTPHSAASAATPPVSFNSSFYFCLFLNFGFDWLEKCNRKQKWILRRKTKNVTKRKWKRKRKRKWIWFTCFFFFVFFFSICWIWLLNFYGLYFCTIVWIWIMLLAIFCFKILDFFLVFH